MSEAGFKDVVRFGYARSRNIDVSFNAEENNSLLLSRAIYKTKINKRRRILKPTLYPHLPFLKAESAVEALSPTEHPLMKRKVDSLSCPICLQTVWTRMKNWNTFRE
jgi:hypothetical protein